MFKTILLVSLFFSACGGTVGPTGPSGPAGPVGPAGAPGTNGTNGTNGTDGKDGTNGTSLVAAAWNSCTFVDATLSLNFYYNTTLFSDGSRTVDCAIQGASFGVSGSGFFAAGQGGATSGSCLVNEDIDAASYGFWEFTVSPGPQALYHDPASASNGGIVTLACTSGT